MSNELLDLLKQTQHTDTTHLNELSRVGKATHQWFLENDIKNHPIHNKNELQFWVCDEGFSALERDIRKASSTIDLVCWGFDPAMELTRMIGTADPEMDGYKTWPRGQTYGDLLAEKAAQGVQVRLLLWYDSAFLDTVQGSALAHLYAPAFLVRAVYSGVNEVINRQSGNAPDMPLVWKAMPGFSDEYKRAPQMQLRRAKPTSAQVRSAYVHAWWKAALSGGIPNLEVRFRQGSPIAVTALKSKYLPGGRDWIEEAGLTLAATHHQKPVLIDYHPGQAGVKAPANPCGYVMGLNSVTDYWDTPNHEYNNPRREVAFGVGADWLKPWHVKPFRDYAIRVSGEALACLNNNFVKAWDRAQTTKVTLTSASLEAVRKSIKPQGVGAHRAQIVRTQPEENDATILKTYVQACSNATNYIYLENQYFQLAEWVKFIKALRQKTVDLVQKAGSSKEKLPPLHLFLIAPQAERSQMVPNTYDALAEMGQATTVKGYHKQVQDLQAGKEVKDNLGNVISPSQDPLGAAFEAWGTSTGELAARAARMETLRRSAQISQNKIQDELQELNIKTLAGMLMTYDYNNEAKDIHLKARDNNAQSAQADQERADFKRANPQKRRAVAKDEDPYDYSEYNIRPSRYREIYIHSKLMLIDDRFITLGSANLNTRSMTVDSEINIAVADHKFTEGARKRVWANLAGDDLDGGDGSLQVTKDTFSDWQKRMGDNATKRTGKAGSESPINNSFIHIHEDPRDAPLMRLA